jgi:hypothetical protein
MRRAPALLALFCLAVLAGAADPSRRFVYPGADGKLVYDADDAGNRIPDFSRAGYGGGAAIPDVPVRVVVSPGKGDNTARIQAAIDYVSGLKPDADGFRGAVLLLAGRHEVAGQLRLKTSGVVLRGQGQGKDGTQLIATGTDRRTLLRVFGKADLNVASKSHQIAAAYVPVGATKVRLKSADGLRIGDRMRVEHPCTKEWIAAVGMDRFPSSDQGSWLDWKPGSRDLHWERVVTAIDGETITLDAPITSALDAKLSAARVVAFTWPGRIERVGIENLRCDSAADPKNPHDEDHAWDGVDFENVADAWVRQVTFRHFAGSAVRVWESCRSITVEDCTSLDPVSELGGYRRHTFYTAGQLTLFLRCQAENGRHDFAVGYLASGPNAFVECEARDAKGFSGPIESWTSGVLYDNVAIDGAGLALTNRETDAHGVGWAAADSVLWQCTAANVTCRTPPTAQNWAIGVWGQVAGDGHWRSLNQFAKPESLFAAQLAERLGPRASEIHKRRDVPTQTNDAPAIDAVVEIATSRAPQATPKPVSVKNGWLVCDGRLLIGGRIGTDWWKGEVLPSQAARAGVGVTRFVPGRVGHGFTDDLDELTDAMRANGQTILEHHYGLWYDRRRDDHEMVRRADAEVWPPFYEQPWARSGRGTAWDGLSKYDLTRFNPWYFARLKQFADFADGKGLLLVQQMYFQHNLLEAGAHWVDCPWRPANCLQATGFPEPPPFAGKKHIFMAEEFYDVTHAVRQDLHRAYIRYCLDVLGPNSNVIFQTGEEFTGPLKFMQFWHDTVAEWEKDKGRKVLVCLSCTKDVQDAILADPERGPRVALIDMKYWWYTANGGVYDPKGGESLAPRQQLREWKGNKSRSDASIARQIREYRVKYPDKAILCSLEPAQPWAVLLAGGSVPHLPPSTDTALLAALPRMMPFEPKGLPEGHYALADPGRDYLVYTPAGAVRLDLSDQTATFAPHWIDLKTGAAKPAGDAVPGGKVVEFRAPGKGAAVLWLTKK